MLQCLPRISFLFYHTLEPTSSCYLGVYLGQRRYMVWPSPITTSSLNGLLLLRCLDGTYVRWGSTTNVDLRRTKLHRVAFLDHNHVSTIFGGSLHWRLELANYTDYKNSLAKNCLVNEHSYMKIIARKTLPDWVCLFLRYRDEISCTSTVLH